MNSFLELLPGREKQVIHTDGKPAEMACGKNSVTGSVSQRACVFCGSLMVPYPIADALHIVHGPVGYAAYTRDIHGTLSSGPQQLFHRLAGDGREPCSNCTRGRRVAMKH